MKANRFAGDASGKMNVGPVPDDLAERAAENRSALVEMVAETDDALMEAFFEAGDLSDAVRRSLDQLGPTLEAHGARLDVAIDERVPTARFNRGREKTLGGIGN